MKTNVSARIVLHSASPHHNHAIITASLVYPRFIHAEAKTHRVMSIDDAHVDFMQDISFMDEKHFSRNAMSSRAVPIQKMIDQVRNDPAMPVRWGSNQPGMQAGADIEDAGRAEELWLRAAMHAADSAEAMMNLGLHKQIANRPLEPFQWMHTIVTATETDNFFNLRLALKPDGTPFADPTMYALAACLNEAIQQSKPVCREVHMPYVNDMEMLACGTLERAMMVSAARCARVSYLNHDGSNPVIEKDLALAETLRESGHASPFEHIAVAHSSPSFVSRNLRGWTQMREIIGL